MTTTPVSKSKLSTRYRKQGNDIKNERESSPILQSILNTPSSRKIPSDGDCDYSPVYFPLTQESNEEIDVLWDWHSPQASQKRRRNQKRLVPSQSPKFPLKRHSPKTQNFERLKNELKALQEELAQPDDESCLCVSPQQEMELKGNNSNNLELELSEQQCDEFNNLFDDSIDEEQLVLFSQKIESEMCKDTNTKWQNLQVPTKKSDDSDIDNLISKYTNKNLDELKNPYNTKVISKSNNSKFWFQRTFSDNSFDNKNTENVIQTVSGKLEFHRTKSFELSGNLMQNTLEEIERKRLEAKAKLESKKKAETLKKSPLKSLTDEIEKKRLQALAKLEAKRLQDNVEQKRQQALKKLQVNRMKNACQVKSTLSTRL